MSNYSIELRNIIKIFDRQTVESWFTNYELSDYLKQDQIDLINQTGIWSKEKLAKKIVDHYFMREIGFETPALFKHYVFVTMQEIMEYYLPVIYSNAIKFDPLVNVDYIETYEREITGTAQNQGTSNSNSSSQGSGLNVSSDTPQGQISKSAILNGSYASSTNASETQTSITDTTNNSSSGSNNTNENYSKKIKGNSGVSATAQALIKQYRDVIRAVDREIIEELDVLFMGLY